MGCSFCFPTFTAHSSMALHCSATASCPSFTACKRAQARQLQGQNLSLFLEVVLSSFLLNLPYELWLLLLLLGEGNPLQSCGLKSSSCSKLLMLQSGARPTSSICSSERKSQ